MIEIEALKKNTMENNRKRITVPVVMSRELVNALNKFTNVTEYSRSKIVCNAVEYWLKNEGAKLYAKHQKNRDLLEEDTTNNDTNNDDDDNEINE